MSEQLPFDTEFTVTATQDVQPSLELRIIKEQPGILEWDFDGLNKALDLELSRFKDAVITVDNFNDAKKVRADLNALSKAINDKKIQVKKTFNAPYLDFESKVKVLIAKISDVVYPIDNGIKALEEKEKLDKRNEIVKYFMELLKKYDELFASNMQFEHVFVPSWLNKSCAKSKWQSELESNINRLHTTYQSFHSMYPGELEKVKELQRIFCTMCNYNQEQTLLIYKRLQESKAQQNQDVTIQEVVPESNNNNNNDQPIQQTVGNVPLPQAEQTANELIRLSFEVKATKEQLNALAAFMNESGIKFRQLI